jgi:hypothetical protein
LYPGVVEFKCGDAILIVGLICMKSNSLNLIDCCCSLDSFQINLSAFLYGLHIDWTWSFHRCEDAQCFIFLLISFLVEWISIALALTLSRLLHVARCGPTCCWLLKINIELIFTNTMYKQFGSGDPRMGWSKVTFWHGLYRLFLGSFLPCCRAPGCGKTLCHNWDALSIEARGSNSQ